MKVEFRSLSKIKADLGINKGGYVQRYFTNRCYARMDKYVPMRDGNLRKNVDIGEDYITYESPYAHAQYVGYTTGPVKNYTTPGTGPYWDKRMKSAEMKSLVKEVNDLVRR